jgi:hypothetical protein
MRPYALLLTFSQTFGESFEAFTSEIGKCVRTSDPAHLMLVHLKVHCFTTPRT